MSQLSRVRRCLNSHPADCVSTEPVNCCGSLVSSHFCRIHITTFHFGHGRQKTFQWLQSRRVLADGEDDDQLRRPVQADQAGLSPNRQLRVGEPARPNLTLLMPDPAIPYSCQTQPYSPYSCQTQLSRPYTQNHPDTQRIVVPKTLQPSIHARIVKPYTRAHLT